VFTVPDRYRRTDRQTDRRLTVASPRSALASRGKKQIRKQRQQSVMTETITCDNSNYTSKMTETTSTSVYLTRHWPEHSSKSVSCLTASHLHWPKHIVTVLHVASMIHFHHSLSAKHLHTTYTTGYNAHSKQHYQSKNNGMVEACSVQHPSVI